MGTGNRRDALFQHKILSNKSVTKFLIQKIKALQAHGKNSQFLFQHIYKYLGCLRRASFRLPVKGSVTIEASIAIPVFLFCFLEIMSLLNYLTVYSGVLCTLKSIGDSVSVYGYVYDEVMFQEENLSIGENIISSLIFSEVYLDTQIKKRCDAPIYRETIRGGIDGIHMLGSYIDEQDKMLLLVVNYVVEPIIPFAGTTLHMNNRFYTKLWTGYLLEKSSDKDYVYITENASVYHLTEDCTYLKLSIKSIRSHELSEIRNQYGERYKKCAFCCDKKESPNLYYVTSQGDRYHEDISCLGLKRTVYRVEKKEVEHLKACSRCG